MERNDGSSGDFADVGRAAELIKQMAELSSDMGDEMTVVLGKIWEFSSAWC
jgi:hypothetical protein